MQVFLQLETLSEQRRKEQIVQPPGGGVWGSHAPPGEFLNLEALKCHLWCSNTTISENKIKNKLRTIEAQIVQKLKNEARPKFTGSYKKKKPCK